MRVTLRDVRTLVVLLTLLWLFFQI